MVVGQTHASTDADINYHSPWPFRSADTFSSNVGNHAALHAHPETSSYNYLKFTAPEDGYYEFGLQGNMVIKNDNDYHALGMTKNSIATASSGEPTYYFFQCQRSGIVEANNYPYNATVLMYMSANDYAVPYANPQKTFA